MLPELKPIPIKDRISLIFLKKCQIDVVDGAFVAIDVTGIRIHILVGSIAAILLEPGTRISHAAVAIATRVTAIKLSMVLPFLAHRGVLNTR